MEPSSDLLTLAIERFAIRDYHGAALALFEITRGGSAYADAYNLLGLTLAMLDRPSEALDALDQALRINPNYIEAHLNRGIVLNQLGRTDEAQAEMEYAESLGAPDSTGYPTVVANKLANAHRHLGELYRAAGSLDEAVAQFRRALELRPRFADIRLVLGRTLIDAGRYDDAARELDAALDVRPNWLDAMLLRGLVGYLQGDFAAARAVWDEAAARHPDEPRLEVYRNMLERRISGA